MAGDNQQFCLRWNNHQSTLISVFDSLLESGTLVDCTLAAEGQYLKAHKVVLSACSPYLELLLSQHYEKHPIVILKDVKFQELKSMMDYMYRGEVNITQDQLATFLKAAESLQIKGLSESSGSTDDARDVGSTAKRPREEPPPRRPVPPHPQARLPHSSGLTIEPRRSIPHSSEMAPASPMKSREGSTSPVARKRRRRRPSGGDDASNAALSDSQLDTSNSCDLPPVSNQAQSTPISVPSILATPSASNNQSESDQPLETEALSRFPNTTGSELMVKTKMEPNTDQLIEPKTEYLEDINNEDSVEDLTLDDDDEMPGPSHADGSNQNFSQWQMAGDRSTDEVFMAAQEAVGAHRDSQDTESNLIVEQVFSYVDFPECKPELDDFTKLLPGSEQLAWDYEGLEHDCEQEAGVGAAEDSILGMPEPAVAEPEEEPFYAPVPVLNGWHRESSLRSMLSETPEGRSILSSYDRTNNLTVEDKKVLTHIIIAKEINRNGSDKISASRLRELAEEVCVCFPTEVVEHWYAGRDAQRSWSRGKLYEKYKHAVRSGNWQSLRNYGNPKLKRGKKTNTTSSKLPRMEEGVAIKDDKPDIGVPDSKSSKTEEEEEVRDSKIDLRSMLSESRTGRKILRSYEKQKSLSELSRNLLTIFLIRSELNGHLSVKIPPERYREMAKSVCECFPTENETDWFRPRRVRQDGVVVQQMGRLYNKYIYYKYAQRAIKDVRHGVLAKSLFLKQSPCKKRTGSNPERKKEPELAPENSVSKPSKSESTLAKKVEDSGNDLRSLLSQIPQGQRILSSYDEEKQLTESDRCTLTILLIRMELNGTISTNIPPERFQEIAREVCRCFPTEVEEEWYRPRSLGPHFSRLNASGRLYARYLYYKYQKKAIRDKPNEEVVEEIPIKSIRIENRTEPQFERKRGPGRPLNNNNLKHLKPRKEPEHEACDSGNELRSLLSQIPEGQQILNSYNDSNELTEGDRKTLSNLLILKELNGDASAKICRERFREIARNICSCFPTELERIWYKPRVRCRNGTYIYPSGKLYQTCMYYKYSKKADTDKRVEEKAEGISENQNRLKNLTEPHPERSDSRPGRSDSRPERSDSHPERSDSLPERKKRKGRPPKNNNLKHFKLKKKRVPNELRSLLYQIPEGQQILNSYNSSNKLTDTDRKTLSIVLIRKELNGDVSTQISPERFQEIAQNVCRCFPTEVEKQWYRPKGRCKNGERQPSGWLYRKYVYYKYYKKAIIDKDVGVVADDISIDEKGSEMLESGSLERTS
nr:PREDICTED: uncharacterized protein LOC109037149 isoform X1 [Bemisia tabaci]XP_018907202.1 PREDICTED: uncharacterized protein LOC109037149 isoform X1 [Bemisia tabaci]